MAELTRLEKLEAIVRDLARRDPVFWQRSAGLTPAMCILCGRHVGYGLDVAEVHAPDCPWLRAKKLMEGER